MKGILYTILICFCTLLFQNKPVYAQSLTDEALIDLINAECPEHHGRDDEDDDRHDKKKHDKDDKKKHDDKDDSEDCYKQLKNTLSANAPLSDVVLIVAINRTPSLPPGILKDILLDNSPLSNRIFAELLTTKRKKKDKDKGKDEDEEDDDNGEEEDEDDDDEVDATLKGLVLPSGHTKENF